MTQSLKGIKANAIVSATSSITTSTSVGGNLLPTGNVTYDIGSSTARWKDLYLSNNTIFLGNTAVSANSILPINLDIAPEVLTIQVAAPDAGDDTTWFWTWETSTLPYARTSITNSPQVSVPMYKQGVYTVNNFAGATIYGNMTQTHGGKFKWIDGAGNQNLVDWAVDNGNVSVTHPDINGGVSTVVKRTTVTVPSTVTPPTLTQPSGISYNVSFVSAGSYTISGDADGNNKSIGPLYRGSTYTFNLAASLANHPFYITTDNGTGFVANTYVGEYTNGVVGSRNNGSSGQTTLVFTVPNNAPDTLYYQCGVHSSMRGAIVIKDLAVETNINGNYVIYFQHTHEGHKTPIEIRPIPSLVNQMCVVYDASVGKFVPQDLATYVENTPSFKNKIREVAGTATLIAPNGVAVVPTVLVVEDVGYLPLINNKNGDIAFDSYTDTMYVWETNAWRSTKPSSLSLSTGNISITGGTANYFLKTDGSGNLSWDSPSTTPKISSITYPGDDTAAIPAGGQTITLTGSGFNSGASVLINGTYASVVTVVSSTSITFTAPAMAAGTYTLYVINTDGGTSISVPGISYSGTPIWSTSAGSLGTSYETSSISNSLSATGDNPITYSLYSGTLPPGSSLNSSTGLISGTSQSTASSTTYSFTIRATDAQNQDTDRAFSLTINPDLVSWSSPANASVITSYEYSNISNVTLSATSAVDGSNVSYSANSLPTGISLSGSTISGISNTVANTSVLITATSNTTTRTSSETIYFNVQQDSVTWSTPADNTTYNLSTNEVMSNVAMSASSAAGKSITYTANALPTGLSITGANIAGTPTISGNSSSLVTATASTTNRTATRTINWVISVANDTYWKNTTLLLNGETTVTPFISDASTNSFGLTIQGDTKPNNFNPYTPGYYSNYFDGASDSLSFPGSLRTAMGGGFAGILTTMEAWIYTSTNGTIFGRYDAIGENGRFYWAVTSNNLTFLWTLNTADATSVTSTGSLVISNQWNHVAITIDATTASSSIIKMFINGTLSNTFTSQNLSSQTAFASSNPPAVAAQTAGSSAFLGYISNFRVVTGSLVYTSSFTPSTTPLTAIANTSLLTCQSNRLIDNSTNNFTITKVGDTTISPAIPFTANSSYSTYGSTYFDGTGDYLQLATPPSSVRVWWNTNFTVECWIYPTTLTGSSYNQGGNETPSLIGNASTSSDGNYWTFGPLNDGTVRLYYYNGGSVFSAVTTETVKINQWNHLAFVNISGTGYKMYINGVGTSNIAVSGTPLSGSELPLIIGYKYYSTGSKGFTGYISDVRIVSGTAVYTANFTPSTTPLTAITNTSLLTLQYNGGANNSGFVDNSNFNNIITRNGNTSQGTFSPYSVTGWSNYFNGSAGYITSASSTNNSLGSGNYTIEFWCYSNSLGGSSAGSPFYVDSGGYQQLIRHNGSNWECYYRSGASFGYVAIPTGNITLNAWTHHALVRSSGTVKWYINGVQYASTSDATNYTSATFFVIGNYAGYIYDGYVSNVRVVKGTAVYTSAFTPPTTPLTPILGTVFLTAQSNRFIDNGPNNNTLTITSTPSVQAFGPFGSVPEAVPISYSNYFDGTGDYLSIPDNTALDLATGGGATAPFTGAPSFTIECWFYCTALTATPQDILNKDGTSGSAYTQYSFTITSAGLLKLVLGHGENGSTNNGTEQSFTILNSISLNTWYHVAACQATPNQIYTFLNGVLIATTTRTQYMANGSGRPLLIGYHTGQASTYAFNGYVSNVRIIKGTALYTSSFTPSTTPLTAIANTSLLTCQSNRFIDNSTNNFTITANGNTVPRIFNPFGYTAQSATSYTPSIHGGSAYFDGTGDNLTIPNSAFDLTPTTWSIEYWIYPTTISSATYYGLWALSTSGFRQGIYGDSGTHYLVVLNGGSGYGGFSLVASNKVITLNNWQHVALTSDGTTIRQFYNGVQTSTGSAASFSASTPTIGSWGGANYFTGYMSDFRITKGSAVYTSNFVPSIQTLTNYSTSYPSSLLLNFNNGGIIDQHGTNVLETVGNTQLSTAVKKYGSASMYFDGTGDWLFGEPNQAFNLSVGDFTVELWVYFTGSNNSRGIWAVGVSGGRSGVGFNIGTTGRLQSVYGNGANCDFREGTTVVQLNTWNHIALSRAGSTNRMYLNGVLENTFTLSNFGAGSYSCYVGDGWGISAGNLVRMSSAASGPILGYIDDLRITKGYARYTANFTPPSALITK